MDSVKPAALRLASALIAAVLSASGCTAPPDRGKPERAPSPATMSPDERVRLRKYDLGSMSPEEMAAVGEVLIFGRAVGGDPGQADVGRGMCPLCHRVIGGIIKQAAPDLTSGDPTGLPIGLRGEVRIADPRYQKADFARRESSPGSGRARNNMEYIAESHACPSCYVVEGFGKKGSGDRESPMVSMHLPPNCQSIEESVMIDVFLYVKDGLDPPPAGDIRAAYEKFLPESVRSTWGCN